MSLSKREFDEGNLRKNSYGLKKKKNIQTFGFVGFVEKGDKVEIHKNPAHFRELMGNLLEHVGQARP